MVYNLATLIFRHSWTFQKTIVVEVSCSHWNMDKLCPKKLWRRVSVSHHPCVRASEKSSDWLKPSSMLSSFWQKFLTEPFLQKYYFLFLEILNKKENKEASTICFEIKIQRKRKYNFWRNGSFKNFCQNDDNNWADIWFVLGRCKTYSVELLFCDDFRSSFCNPFGVDM